ncbi:MAG: hypothetical protein EBX40_06410, partial [Gammaproteobacteria bacterium]|nr:hypothetical protein [Gammaproteobacteria bacterium]
MSSLSSGQKKNHGQQPVVAQSMDQERLLMHKYAEKFRLSVRDYFVKENSKKLSKKFDKNASEFLKQSKAFSGSMAAGSALKLKLNLNRYTYADFVSFLEKFATSWESRTYKPWWWKSSQQHKLHSIIRDLIEKMKSEHSLYSADLSKQKEKAEQALRAAELEAVKAKEAAASEKAQREIAEAQVREQAVLLQSYGNLSQAVPTLLSFVDPRHASVQLLNEQQKNVAALTAAAQILHGAHGAANLAILNAQSHNAAACASIAFHQTTALACKASEILDAMVVREVAVREGERARGIQNQQTFLEANRRSLSDAVSKLNAQIKIYKDRVEGQLFSRIRKGHKKLELLLAFSQKITEIEAELAGKNPIPCKGPFDAKKAIKDAWTALSNAAQEKKFNKQGFLERTMELQAIMTTLDTVIPLPPVEISPTLTEGEVAQIRQEL